MYSSFLGNLAKADAGRPSAFESTSGGVCPSQSVLLKVPNSEKAPSSKIRTKWVSSGPRPWSRWPWPRGKYQTSPGSKSFTSEVPSGPITVVRTRPLTTKAHSAAMACQCSSRMPPGLSRIDTPARPLETGSSLMVACLAEPPSVLCPRGLSSIAYRKVGSSSELRSCPP